MPFSLDLVNECLRRGEQALPLTRKAFAVLCYLVEHPGRLVSKRELLDAVWPQTFVSEGVLTNCILRLRAALADEARTPRFIETVHGRGYRLIAPLATTQPVSSLKSQVSSLTPASSPPPLLSSVVGREAELKHLHEWLDKALAGARQLVFVTGEAGIGKTTVVEAFLAQLAAEAPLWIGGGQCIEHHGAGEAYMPVLEALGRLCRAPGGERLLALLSHHAPTWLVQMPALLNATELQALQRRVQGVTRERMLREMAEALEACTAEQPVVLVLEDLHWSDVSTLDLLSVLARRREQSRLLAIGTYRPLERVEHEQPLRAVTQELHLHGQCEELRLEGLSEGQVREYLAGRFAGSVLPAELARGIHRRTSGNPLFMVTVVEEVLRQGGLVEVAGRWVLKGAVVALEDGVPENLQQMIEKQLERLGGEEQRVLEVASVAGAEFPVAAVAAALKQEIDAVEDVCEGIAWQGHFLEEQGIAEWPDGTVSGHYSFRHALYQNVLYERIAEARRVRLHRAIGERIEAGYGEEAKEIAAELAVHFERGRDYPRAIQYLQQAGQNAAWRSANAEAINHLTKGLKLLKLRPDTPEHTQQELTLQVALGAALMAAKGYTVPEVEKTYARARELCRQVGDTLQLLPVLFGLFGFYSMKGESHAATELAEQIMALAQRGQDPAFLLLAHRVWGVSLYGKGELTSALKHFEQVMTLYNREQHHSLASLSILDSGVHCRAYAAEALWLLGYPDQALKRIQEACTLSRELSHPASLIYAPSCAAIVYQVRQDAPAVQEQAETAIALSTEDGFPFLLPELTILHGWALVTQGREEEGIAQVGQGLAAKRAMGAEGPNLLYFRAVLAEAYGKVGQLEEGLALLAEALELADGRGVHCFESELIRLQGELTLQQFQVPSPKSQVATRRSRKSNTQHRAPSTQAEAEAEECFHKAIEIARRQSAKSLELRAVMSLARLWQQQGKKKKARQMLAEIYGWFTEGFDTKDLQEAKALLEDLEK